MRRPPFVSVTLGLSLIAGLACRGETNAPPAPSPVRMPDLVVTPSRAARDPASEPCTVYRIAGDDATLRRASRTLPDALAGLPSVMAQKTSYGQGSPFLRGFTGFRTLCLIDGVRLNNSVFREGPNQYWGTLDPLSADAYEMVMGPASTLYGSDAIGGTVNVLPIAPPDDPTWPAWHSRLYGRAASADRSLIGRAQAGARLSEDLAFVGGVSSKTYGDLRGGHEVGEQDRTGYTEGAYDARLDWHLGGGTLTFVHQTVDQNDAWRTHKTIYGTDWEGLAIGDERVHAFDQHRDLTYLKYRTGKLDGPVDRLQCTVSRHVQTEDLYRVKKDDKRERQGFEVDTWGAALQAESDTRAGRWICGGEYYRDGVDAYLRKYKANGQLDKVEIQGPVADDATYESLGLYVADTVPLLDGWLDLQPGLRYTRIHADANAVKDPLTGARTTLREDWDALAGSLRALCPLTSNRRHALFAGVSQGFRAPNLSDLTRLDTARSNEIETPSPDLDPERYLACELGFRSRLARLASTLSYYYTAIDGMIVRTPTGRSVEGYSEVTKLNSGHGYVHGVELTESFRWNPHWSTRLAATWMEGEVDAYPTSAAVKEREPVSRLMPPTAELTVRWEPTARCWTEIAGVFTAKADKLSADDKRDTQRIPPGGTPGYAVCHLRAGAEVAEGLNVTLALENALDADYRIHGSGVNEPGRNLVCAAAWDL